MHRALASVQPPYLGAAYYPEVWPASQIDEDIALMKEAGLNVVRMGEFAWSKMEPREGHYDFSWLHEAVDKLAQAGIASILGTPTCTPPAWLSQKHPEILVVSDTGVRAQHGARRHACPNSPVYRDYCERIVTRMAEEFGRDPNVLAWQIDNELYPWGRGCCCPVCHARFLDHLKERFGTIEALNAAWGTGLWSQSYDDFHQIPVPRSDTWHHPSLVTEWMLFQSDSYADFAEHQEAILHRLTRQPVGTDMMPFNGLDYYRIHRKLDLVQFNHYNDASNLWEAAFWMDWCRPIKPHPFWVTETSTCWGGSTVPGGFNPPGFCRANSWLPLALGGEANLYWLWRAHRSGQELMHGSVVSSCGCPMHVFGEVQEIARGIQSAGEFLRATRPARSGIAMHMSHFAWWFFQSQPLVQGFDYREKLLNGFYRTLLRMHLRPDVIDPSCELAAYRVLVSPFLPALDEAGLRPRLKAWIEAGGTWIAGPFTDIRTCDSTKFTHAPFGSLEEWGGVSCRYEIPANLGFSLRWSDAGRSTAGLWYSGFETRGAQALAVYEQPPLEGLAAVTSRPMGKGRVVVLGTLLAPQELEKVLTLCRSQAGVEPMARASENLLVVPREGDGGRGAVVVEIENRPGTLSLARPARDLLSGRLLCGEVEVAPYGVLVLKDR